MNRGDRRERIFMDDADRQRFVETLGEVCAKTDWQVHASVLRPNHFHWVVETPQPNQVAGMKWLLGTYTSRFNRRPKLIGHLFSGRSKSLIVDGSGSGYLKSVGDYVHLNPARRQRLERALEERRGAELIIAEELKRGRWQEVDLKSRPKGDSVKVAFAACWRAVTTITVGWIAERLAMGTRGYLNPLLDRRRKLGGE